MIVDESHRLHKSIKGRGAHKAPTPLSERVAHRPRLLTLRQLEQDFSVDPLGSISRRRLELPEKAGQAAEIFDDLLCAAGIMNGGFNLTAVSNDPRVVHESINTSPVESRDFHEIEVPESPTEGFALPQNGQPAEPRLESLQANLLEETSVVDLRPPPLVIVVHAVVQVLSGPTAADNTL